ncbi:MAG: DEAD/DEAH box helicase [Bacteroidales bacterium]
MKQFAICQTKHRVLGPLFIPVFFKQVPGKEFYAIDERITLNNLSSFESSLQDDEIELVKLNEEYSDSQIVKTFSKKKTNPQDFLSSIDENLFTLQIRPYIERRLLKCIEILQGSNIPLFHKEKMNNIYESERISIIEENVESVFNFKRVNGELSYFLSIKHLDKEIKLFGKEGAILVNEPCRIVIGNSLYIFDNIDGKKLLPFFSKEYIQVPQRAEKKFLEGFVKNVIRKYKVNSDAFKIIDKQVKPFTILSFENDLSGKPMLLLKFRYDEETTYYANKKTELKVVLAEEDSIPVFYRLNRDDAFENEVIFRLLDMGLKNQHSSYFFPLRTKVYDNFFMQYELVNWLNFNADELKNSGIEVVQNEQNLRFYLKKFELITSVTENQNDWFDINIIVKFAGFEIPFIRFRNHILNEDRQYLLPDGEIVILPEEWFSRFKDILAFARIENTTIALEKQHYILLQEGLKGLKDSYARKLKKWFDDKPAGQPAIPDSIQAQLRPYQAEGFGWMIKLYENGFGGCLADDMGLGKTLQTLTLLVKVIQEENLKDYGPAVSTFDRQLTIFDMMDKSKLMKSKPSLVVVPTSLIYNWMKEVIKFAPQLKISYYGGQNRKPLQYYYNEYEIIITSYGIIRNDIELFKKHEFLYVILDESQLVKNPLSKTYKALLQLKTEYRLALTGTPIENSLTDLWAQMNFLNPGLLGSLEFFKNEFKFAIEKEHNDEQAGKLRKLINPFILRRTKGEVAKDLPDISEQTIFCDMSQEQFSFYEAEKSKARNIIMQSIASQGVKKSSIILLQTLTRLRQIANHPVLVNEEYSGFSGKFEEISRNLENIVSEGHKVLVFSSFVKHLDLFARFCDDKRLSYSYLTGETSNRGEVVETFQENQEIRIFLISLKAGGFGLNLTAADYVFLLDPWWNPAVEQQALSRAHRIGQDKNVFVYRFIAKDTIEEKILMLQEKKSGLAEAFISSNNPFAGIEEKDVLELFE